MNNAIELNTECPPSDNRPLLCMQAGAAMAKLLDAVAGASTARRAMPSAEAIVTAYDVILHLHGEAQTIEAEVDERGDIVMDVFTLEGDGVVRIDGESGRVV